MISEIAYISILGNPVIFYLGIMTYVMLLLTAGIMILNIRGIIKFPLNYHKLAAYITITIATVHGLLGLSVYLGF